MKSDINIIEVCDVTALPPDPTVSVYMLAYQHEQFIAQAIESVVAQQCDFSIELIIGEDYSSDRTREIILEYQHRHPSLIRVLTSNHNVGMRHNSERCRAACRGEYVAVCEGDDYWCDPHKLQWQVGILRSRSDLSMVCHCADRVDATSGFNLGKVHTAFRSRILTQRELVLGDGGVVPTASIVVRRAVFDSQPDWWSNAPVDDFPLILRASMLGKVGYLNKTMSMYRVNVSGSWSSQRNDALCQSWITAERLETFLWAFNQDSGNRFSNEVRKMISKYYGDALIHARSEIQLARTRFCEIGSKLTRADKLLVGFTLFSPFDVSWLRTVFRKISTVCRMLMSEFEAELLSSSFTGPSADILSRRRGGAA